MWICFYKMHFDARYFYTAMVDDMRYHLRSTSLFFLSYTLHTHSFIALRLWRMQKKLTFFFRDYWIFFIEKKLNLCIRSRIKYANAIKKDCLDPVCCDGTSFGRSIIANRCVGPFYWCWYTHEFFALFWFNIHKSFFSFHAKKNVYNRNKLESFTWNKAELVAVQ